VDKVRRQKIIRLLIPLPLLLSVATVSTTAHAEVVVIVSAKSPVTNLTPEETARIFLGKVNTFPEGGDAIPIDQAVGSPIRDEFYAKVVHKNAAQLSAYWAKIIFTGDGRPPLKLDSNLAVRRAIAENPNAIGYIEKSAVNRSVRIVLEP
jgi:ABC-type phosphate transport system substrate-binding protein